MGTFVRKRFRYASLGFLFLSLGLPLYGYQAEKPESCKIKMVRPKTKLVTRQAHTIVFLVDNYLKGDDYDIVVSAEKQQSVLWRCQSCTFRIATVVPDLEEKEIPEERREHLKRFPRGPFYREFPDKRDEIAKDRFFKRLSSGAVLLDAAPRKGRYLFKTTLWIQRPGKPVCELDPHIITLEGVGP